MRTAPRDFRAITARSRRDHGVITSPSLLLMGGFPSWAEHGGRRGRLDPSSLVARTPASTDRRNENIDPAF